MFRNSKGKTIKGNEDMTLTILYMMSHHSRVSLLQQGWKCPLLVMKRQTDHFRCQSLLSFLFLRHQSWFPRRSLLLRIELKYNR
jgi:hypothetical protein